MDMSSHWREFMACFLGLVVLWLIAGPSTDLMAQQAPAAVNSTPQAPANAGDVKKPSSLSLKDAVRAGYDPIGRK